MYSINPDTLFGTIQGGPHLLGYEGIDQMEPEQLEKFSALYKAFAANVFNIMHGALEQYAQDAINDGYRDIACNIEQYQIGMLIISVVAENPISSSYRNLITGNTAL